MSALPIAHFGGGHWWEYAIYFTPLLVVALTIALESWRHRRQSKRADRPTEDKNEEADE